MQRVKTLLDGGARSIIISPNLLWKPELPHEPAVTSTQGPNGQVMMSAKEIRNASHLVQYLKHLKPVDESEDLVIPIKAYDLVLDLPWFRATNPEIDWTTGRVTAVRTTNVPQWGKAPHTDDPSPLPERGNGNTKVDPPSDIPLLGATTFKHLLASEELVKCIDHMTWSMSRVPGSIAGRHHKG
jgi:hypothetical protein